MAKALPVLGILGALFAALVVAVLADLAMLLPVLVAVAGSVVLLGQRTVPGTVAGLLVFIAAVVAAFGITESISTEDGSLDLGIPYETGIRLAMLACLALPVAATILRWDLFEARWLPVAGIACAAVAFILAATDPTDLADHGTVRAIVTAAFALASLGPMVPLLRVTDDDVEPSSARNEPAPLATADATVGAAAAKTPPSGTKRAPDRRP